MPQPAIERGSWVGISVVRKTIVAIVKVAARVTKAKGVPNAVRNVSII